MEQLLQKIRKLREGKGFTQEEMAFELHMSQKAYCQLENGITRLDVGRLIAISEVLESLLPSCWQALLLPTTIQAIRPLAWFVNREALFRTSTA
jgi:transcriptional regulator with XRE-family HTH domain